MENIVTLHLQARCIQSLAIFVQIIHVFFVELSIDYMESFKKNSVAYPPPSTAPAYYVAPPPAGYPTKDGSGYSQNPPPPVETKSRGDGFWKGW